MKQHIFKLECLEDRHPGNPCFSLENGNYLFDLNYIGNINPNFTLDIYKVSNKTNCLFGGHYHYIYAGQIVYLKKGTYQIMAEGGGAIFGWDISLKKVRQKRKIDYTKKLLLTSDDFYL